MLAFRVLLIVASVSATATGQEESSCDDFLVDYCDRVPTSPGGCSGFEEYCAKTCGFCTDSTGNQEPNGPPSGGSASNSSSPTPRETCVDVARAPFCRRVKRFSGTDSCDDQDPGVREVNILFCANTGGCCTPNDRGQNGTSVNGPNSTQTSGTTGPNGSVETPRNGTSPNDPVASGPADGCFDTSPAEFCAFMEASALCTYPRVGSGQGMQLYCAKTCGACEQSSNPPPNGASPNEPIMPPGA